MKKVLISVVAVAFVALMIANAYGNGACLPTIPTPPKCCCAPPGLTPGFWKHDITVYLAHMAGDPHAPAYNAFPDGTKLTDGKMKNFLDAINSATGLFLDFSTALAILQLPGWSTDRTNLANWFSYEAGYGWY